VQWLPHALLVRAFAVFLLANALRTWVRTGAPHPVATAAPGRAPDGAGRARRP
jgi:hypothetical protein